MKSTGTGCRLTSKPIPNAETSGTVWLDYSREPVVTPLFPVVFSQSLSPVVIQQKMVRHIHADLSPLKLLSFHVTFQEVSAAFLLPLLLEEQIHIQHSNLICCPRELKPHVTCGNATSYNSTAFISPYYL